MHVNLDEITVALNSRVEVLFDIEVNIPPVSSGSLCACRTADTEVDRFQALVDGWLQENAPGTPSRSCLCLQ